VAGLQAAEVVAVGVPLAGIASKAEGLKVAEVVRTALVFGHDVVHLQGPLGFIRSAAHAADRGAVAQ
jgi:hypothetical protein